MKDEEKCHYTNMLNRLKMLDEQICQMQTTLKTVKDIMRKNGKNRQRCRRKSPEHFVRNLLGQ